MGFPKDFHWISVGFPWDFHRISMGFPLDFHGISWDFHGISRILAHLADLCTLAPVHESAPRRLVYTRECTQV